MGVKVLPYKNIEALFKRLQMESADLKLILMNAILEMQNKGLNPNMRNIGNNILENQQRDEEMMPKESRLRFYRPYFDSIPKVPDLVKKQPMLIAGRYKMPEYLSTELRIDKPTEEEYMQMSDEDKKSLVAQLFREFAIVSARKANAQNRRKDEYQEKIADCYQKKDMHIKSFLMYAQAYNAMVPESEQLCFGLEQDNRRNLVLYSSLPGYTRMSVHLGAKRTADSILIGVNEYCQKNRLPIFPLETSKLCTQYRYPLRNYTINTGLVNSDSEKSKEYEQQIMAMSKGNDGKPNVMGMEEFAMFMYPEFNSRETIYLAEKAGLGKGFLVKFEEIEKRKQLIKEKALVPNEIRRGYLQKRVQKAEKKEDKLETLKSLWDKYQMIVDAEGKTQDVSDCYRKYVKMISDMGLEPEIVEEITKQISLDISRSQQTKGAPKSTYQSIKSIASETRKNDRNEAESVEQGVLQRTTPFDR